MRVSSYDKETVGGSLVNDLLVRLAWTDAARADRLLRITLCGIRDRIPDAEFARLLRRLPPLLRVVDPTASRPASRVARPDADGTDFVAQMRAASGERVDMTAETVGAVFAILARYVLLDGEDGSGESLAHRLLALWPTDR